MPPGTPDGTTAHGLVERYGATYVALSGWRPSPLPSVGYAVTMPEARTASTHTAASAATIVTRMRGSDVLIRP